MTAETINTIIYVLIAIMVVILLLILLSGYRRAKRVNKKASSKEVIERYKKLVLKYKK